MSICRACLWTLFGGIVSLAVADDGAVPPSGVVSDFDRQALTRTYFSEGAAVGDIDGDGVADVVYGPYWFAGPDFSQAHEIYPPQPQNMNAYADHFFAWLVDLDLDGWQDILVVGFPGTPAYVYENPGPAVRGAGHWKRHQIFDWVSNESPQFTDLTGDGRPELVCTREGMFGYAVPQWGSFGTWKFQRISGVVAPDRFGHALGVGDVDGDGRMDVLMQNGWFRNPGPDQNGLWPFQGHVFCGPGGADMYAYDVNGDGWNDVITSVDAHGYGLVWWEQVRDPAGAITFREHTIMGSKPSGNKFGLHISELHSVRLADIDGDGLLDIVTGKTYWSHHRKSPEWDAGAHVVWFRLKRHEDGSVDWVPYLADDQAGIGRQIVVADVNGNGLPDIVVGGMLGCHVLTQSRRVATGIEYLAAQPKPRRPMTQDLSGSDAAAYMTVPQGFHVQLAAAEPDIHQPVAMCFDDRGRLWVAEAYNYPTRAADGEGLDKIIILEDTNVDGVFDTRKVFAENLNLVSGLEVFLFIPDRDGDDVPDGPPQILLDGFGYQDTHETLNTFNWGPDGWLYGCHGVFTHSRVGKPGTLDIDRIPMNAAIWRYHPTRHEFEVFAWGTSNPWGIDFNDYGQAFATACVIPHLFHVIQGGQYQRQAGQHFNPHVYDDIKTIADHAHYAGNIGDHAWWGHEPTIQDDTSDAGGGHAHCGAMVYLGDNWPVRYRNRIFFNNIHGNRVNSDRLVRHGSGYLGRHADDLLLANDHWFRGINLRCGPDGSVYLIDWYDRNACHRTNPEIWDRTNGRVYHIAYGVPHRQRVDLAKMSDEDLARMAWRANDWYVRTSRRILQDRAQRGVLNALAVRKEIDALLAADDETRVLRGLWLGHVAGLLDRNDLIALTGHPSPYVTGWSIQLLCEQRNADSVAIKRFAELAAETDRDPLVRLYLASALQRINLGERWDIASRLLSSGGDAGDQNIPLMIWFGIEPLVTSDPGRALALIERSAMPQVTQFIIRRAAADAAALNAVVQAVPSWPLEQQRMALEQINVALVGRVNVAMPDAWQASYESLSAGGDGEVREQALRLAVAFGDLRAFPQLREILADGGRPLADRQRALDILVQGRDREAAAALFAALETPELQSAAIRALAALADPQTPEKLLGCYSRLAGNARDDAIATLVSRAPYAHQLLDAIETGMVARSDVHAFHVRQMANLGDEALMARITNTWGRVGESSEEQKEAIELYRSKLTSAVLADADPSHGRMLYNKHCAACHQLFGEGEKVGPDLTGSNRADLDYILENLVAPNAVVGKDYQMTLLQLIDGRVVSGLIMRETDSALTLKTINDLVIIALDDIEERKLSELSLMPNGLLDPLAEEEVRDLIAYLASPSQVPLKGPRAPIDTATRQVTGAIEGESITVLQKSRGSAGPQDMRGFAKDRWSGDNHLWWTGGQPGDRLVLEFEVDSDGVYEPQVVLTRARDYGIVRLYLDDQPLGDAIDLYNFPDVVTTGVLSFAAREMAAGKHRLAVEIVGRHPQSVPAFMFGLDYLKLEPVGVGELKQ